IRTASRLCLRLARRRRRWGLRRLGREGSGRWDRRVFREWLACAQRQVWVQRGGLARDNRDRESRLVEHGTYGRWSQLRLDFHIGFTRTSRADIPALEQHLGE